MKFDTKQVSWFEDAQLMEYFINEGNVEDKRCEYCSLEGAIEFAWKNKMLLYIQPEEQNAGLFVDYTGE